MGKRLNYEDVKKEVEEQGFALVTQEYTNLKTEMCMECSLGHRFYKTLAVFRKNPVCSVCEANELQKKNISLNSQAAIKKKKGATRVLALDNATLVTGYSIFDDGKLIYYGTIGLGQTNPIHRISNLRQWMLAMIEKWQPDVVGLENIQLQKNPKTFKLLAQLLGVLENTLFEMRMEYYVVESAVWKSHCGVKGRARMQQKESAQAIIRKLYEIECNEDESDAILLGKYLAEKHIKQNQFIEW